MGLVAEGCVNFMVSLTGGGDRVLVDSKVRRGQRRFLVTMHALSKLQPPTPMKMIFR